MAASDPIVRGFSSAVSPLTEALLEADSRDVGAGLRSRGNYMPAQKKIPLSRYYSEEFAALEKAKLWMKVWQFACREEDIPAVGDRVPYTVGDLSFVILRSAPHEFRAFFNTCLHRGTRLCDGAGSGESLRCPFHAWEWNLDGSLRNIPSRWDFSAVKTADYKLPEVKVETWGGFIFINPDPAAAPLACSLGGLPDFFKTCPAEDRFTAFHIRKRVRANWKVTLEAFLESYHVVETHSDSLSFTGDASTQYDIWEDGKSHLSRLITPLGIPSPHLGDAASAVLATNRAFEVFAMAMPGVPVPTYDPASALSGRAQFAEWRRQLLGAGLGRDFAQWADAAMLDSVQYFMFPNFCPWYGEGLPLIYQFLPYGTDPNESLMSVRLTAPAPGGGAPRPPSAPIVELDFDEPFSTKPEIGLLSLIFDQDMSNLPRIQAGLRGAAPGRAEATLGRYQEQRIQHFHEVLEKALGVNTLGV
jgi:phenylpropionate dioxygenase-like ring-hydroxylating dioxygenase large terminal subunit